MKLVWQVERNDECTRARVGRVMGRRPSSLEDDVFRPRLHPVDERLALALAEVFVRIVKADADALVQVLPVSDVAGVNRVLDALFGCAEASTSPPHFSE